MPRKGWNHSLESREKMSRARSGSKHPMWGRKHSPKTIEKMREAKIGSLNPIWKGDEVKEEAIRNRLQRRMPVPKGSDRHHIDGDGRNSDPSNILVLTRREHMIKDGRMEALIKRNEMGRGRKLSPESIEKTRTANLGRKHTPEAIEKMCAIAVKRKRDDKGRFLKRD